MSIAPGSAIETFAVTVEPTACGPAENVSVGCGATFCTISVPLAETGWLTPSDTVSVTVHTPLSLHVIDGLSAAGLEIVQSAPGATPDSGVAVHVYWSGSFSGSVAVAVSGIAEPSLPPVSPTWTSGGALTTIVLESVPVPPSLSVTVTATV